MPKKIAKSHIRGISNDARKHKTLQVTYLLNKIYDDLENQGLETSLKKAQMKSIRKEKW